MCSGFLVIDVFSLLLCVSLLGGSTSVVVGLSPCTALLKVYQFGFDLIKNSLSQGLSALGPEGLEPTYYSILPVCYKNAKFYCSLHEKCNLVVITNKMQLGNGIYYSLLH